MQIHRMTATFGRLDNETLTLTPGLNVFTAPNEAGKSTWAAFLVAMFYGIDTSERAKKGILPAKTKYAPWNGKPMEGVVELTWNGTPITLQRQSEGKNPMAKFTAYHTQTGEVLPFLTAENCGRTLLGIDQSVFVRSAFIGQNAMTVTQDSGLEQKLSSLVTSGDETVSYSQTERRLRDWKNHVRHNKTGYLPEAEGKMLAVTEKLETIRSYHKEDLSLRVRQQELTAQQEKLQYVEKNLKAAEALQKQQQLRAAREKMAAAQETLQKAKEAAEALPSVEKLQALQGEFAALSLRRELTEKTPQPTAPAEPDTPAVFRGLSPEAAQAKAAKDVETLRNLSQEKKPAPMWLASVILASLCGAVFFFAPVVAYILLALAVLSLVGHVAVVSRQKQKNAGLAAQKAAILEQYEAASAEEILLAAARFGEARRQYTEAVSTYEAQTAANARQRAALEQQQQELLTAVRGFASNIYSTADAELALKAALETHRQQDAAQTAFTNACGSFDAIRAAVGDAAVTEAPAEDFTGLYSLPQVSRELTQNAMELRSVETTLAQHQGNVEALGDPAALEAEKQQLEEQIAALQEREAALTIAMRALDEANSLQRSRFSPQISNAAGELLSRMTKGRYEALRMEQDLTLHAKESDDAITRNLLALSGGTADQMYLALRLAVCRLALEEGTPLVLDDALVYFDDTRLAQVMELLKEESDKRQILLFSCQSREAEYLAK